MTPNKKLLITVLAFVLAMLVIACSCSSLIPTSTPPPDQEAIPGLAGTWQDPSTTDTFVIAWQNDQYVVMSATFEGTSYSITSQSWSGSTLTWSYYIPENDVTLSYQTKSVSGDSLNTDWWNDADASGTETLSRVK